MTALPKRKRGRPETPFADFGPRARLDNGTAVLTYRADPERPSAPEIRAAKAFVAYEGIGLTDEAREAADRLLTAAECVAGAKEMDGPTGRSFWEYQGPTGRKLQAARDLNDLTAVCGAYAATATMELVANGRITDLEAARDALATMAEFWGM